MSGVSGHITGITIGSQKVQKAYYNGKLVFDSSDPNIAGAYVIFSSSAKFTLAHPKSWDGVLQYSTNTTTWTEWDGTAITAVKDSTSKKYRIYLRGKKNTSLAATQCYNADGTFAYSKFTYTGSATYTVENDLLYLLDYTTVAAGDDVEPATGCFAYMFSNETKLTSCSAPLSLVVVPDNGYNAMFSGCTSLSKAPEIMAEVLGKQCMCTMFMGCTSLSTLQTSFDFTDVGEEACQLMFGNSGITNAPNFSRTMVLDSAGSNFERMYEGCTSLMTPPSSISITFAPKRAFYSMFKMCSALLSGCTIMCPGTVGIEAFGYMYLQCSGITTNPGSLIFGGKRMYDVALTNMYSNCTSLTKLPTFTGVNFSEDCGRCCYGMFSSCTSLRQIYTFTSIGPGVTTLGKGADCMFYGTGIEVATESWASASATNDYVFTNVTVTNSSTYISSFAVGDILPNTMYKTNATVVTAG